MTHTDSYRTNTVEGAQGLWRRLTPLYEAGEAKTIVRQVLEVRFGLSWADILCGKADELSDEDRQALELIMTRLEKAEPVQYVLGEAAFFGRLFHVAPGVLIPRPETAELCQWIIESDERRVICDEWRVLDIGTGSGCIAITLAKEMEGAKVTAWDISDEALSIASENAKRLDANVAFGHQDILNASPVAHCSSFEVIVSNPPYICNKERAAMDANVMDYEPHLALFVPDDDPLLFYRAIAGFASKALKPGGRLFFEINPLYADHLQEMLSGMSYHEIEVRKDQYGKSRMMSAQR